MATFRNGDRVTVKAEVISDPYDFDGTQKVKLRVEPYHDIFVPVSDLTMDRPDIRVGDAVEWTVGEAVRCWPPSMIMPGCIWAAANTPPSGCRMQRASM